MNHYETILHLFPAAIPRVDFRVQDDGKGPYIAMWNSKKLGSQPTDLELEAVQPELESVKEAKAEDAISYSAIESKVRADQQLSDVELKTAVSLLIKRGV